MLGLKGFSAAILGGLGNPFGAFVGGGILGVIETLAAGYISSAYKDAVSFLVILLVIFFRPQGFFGGAARQRV
jgi:branched-chain amino acid transport system permease protein